MTTQQLWRAIHVYPFVRGVEGFDELLANVRLLLACDDCRVKMDRYVRDCPPDTSSREALFVWGWRFHNAVNVATGKPMMPLDEARAIHVSTDVVRSPPIAPLFVLPSIDTLTSGPPAR